MTSQPVRLDYTDTQAAEVLDELERYRSDHPKAQLLCHFSHPLPGLPVMPRGAENVYKHYRVYYRTPWGMAHKADVPYRRYPTLSYASLMEIAYTDEESNRPYPRTQAPEAAVALVDPIRGLTQVYAGKAADEGAFHALAGADPDWMGMVRIQGKWGSREVLRSVRGALAEAGVPLWVTALFVLERDYPWEHSGVGYAANGEVRVPLVGFALDPDDHEVIYLHIVGHKTALRSIWGSLSTAHSRSVTLGTPTRTYYATSTHNYTTYTDVVDTEGRTGLIRMLIVDKRAYEAEVAEKAYLVAPSGVTGERLERAFATRLSAVLPVGIAPEWGGALHRAGDERDLIAPCPHGGDVEAAYALPADESWIELLDALLANREIVVV